VRLCGCEDHGVRGAARVVVAAVISVAEIAAQGRLYILLWCFFAARQALMPMRPKAETERRYLVNKARQAW